MEQVQAMEVDHDNLSAIVGASKTRVNPHPHMHRGTSIDLYKFHSPNNQEVWRHGHIFHGSNMEDLSFGGRIIQDIEPRDDINKREALFLVEEPNQLENVEATMVTSSMLSHIGILKPFVGGFNTQISKVVTGFCVTMSSLDDWLKRKQAAEKKTSIPVEVQQPEEKKTSIPVEVQQLIRIAYMAIEKIWSAGCTSDELANSGSYYMIDDRIKINPLRIRRRLEAENDMMPLRRAFGEMIYNVIYSKWEDDELLDFIDILRNQAAGAEAVLGHPVLLPPDRRQLMYHKFYSAREELTDYQRHWLQANAHPGADWKVVASRFDPTLKAIIVYQVRQVMKKRVRYRSDDSLVQHRGGFEENVFGALHFSSVVTAHYRQHFKKFTKGNWREEIIGRVDLQLKTVLPRLLTKRYNVMFLS